MEIKGIKVRIAATRCSLRTKEDWDLFRLQEDQLWNCPIPLCVTVGCRNLVADCVRTDYCVSCISIISSRGKCPGCDNPVDPSGKCVSAALDPERKATLIAYYHMKRRNKLLEYRYLMDLSVSWKEISERMLKDSEERGEGEREIESP